MWRRTLVLPDKKRVGAAFVADGRVGSMTRMDDRVVSEGKKHGAYGRDGRRVITARQIRPPDRPGDTRVADEQLLADLALLSDLQTDAARTMPGRVVRAHSERPE